MFSVICLIFGIDNFFIIYYREYRSKMMSFLAWKNYYFHHSINQDGLNTRIISNCNNKILKSFFVISNNKTIFMKGSNIVLENYIEEILKYYNESSNQSIGL